MSLRHQVTYGLGILMIDFCNGFENLQKNATTGQKVPQKSATDQDITDERTNVRQVAEVEK